MRTAFRALPPALLVLIADSAAAAGAAPVATPLIQRAPPAPPPPTTQPPVLAQGTVGANIVSLHRIGDRLALLSIDPAGRSELIPVEGLETTASILADRRFAFAWPAIEAAVGSDFSLFRARRLAELARLQDGAANPFVASSAESATGTRVSALIRATTLAMDIGDPAGAEKMLRAFLARPAPRRARSGAMLDWVVAKARLATVLSYQGRTEDALRELEEAERQSAKGDWALNAMVNRGAMLAEVGKYAEALALIDTAWAQFQRDAGDEGVAGSDRQFAWIRACALHGLGRTAEADATYQVVARSGEVRDPDFIVSNKGQIEWRAQWCMRDEKALKRLMLDELAADRPTMTVVALQPAFRPSVEEPALLARLRADPEISAAFAARARVLPASMNSALRRYQ